MGEMVAEKVSDKPISVKVNLSDTVGYYPPESFLNLDVSKLYSLGWRPSTDLEHMFLRLIRYMQE